jgi:hypothetical protein
MIARAPANIPTKYPPIQGYRVVATTNCGRFILILSPLSTLHIMRFLFSSYITGYVVQEPGSHLAPEACQGSLLF